MLLPLTPQKLWFVSTVIRYFLSNEEKYFLLYLFTITGIKNFNLCSMLLGISDFNKFFNISLKQEPSLNSKGFKWYIFLSPTKPVLIFNSKFGFRTKPCKSPYHLILNFILSIIPDRLSLKLANSIVSRYILFTERNL